MSTLNFEDIVKEVELQCPTVFKLLAQMIQFSLNYDKKTAPLAFIYGIIMFTCIFFSSKIAIEMFLSHLSL